jgi:hypothetical protein
MDAEEPIEGEGGAGWAANIATIRSTRTEGRISFFTGPPATFTMTNRRLP